MLGTVGAVAVEVHLDGEPERQHGIQWLHIVSGLDLQFDPPVALCGQGGDPFGHAVGRSQTDGDPGGDRGGRRSESLRQRTIVGTKLGIEQGHLQRRFRHWIAHHHGESGQHRGGVEPVAEEPWCELLVEYRERSGGELLGVGGLGQGRALTPAVAPVGVDPHHHDLSCGHRTVSGDERFDERKIEEPQLDAIDHHGLATVALETLSSGPWCDAPLLSRW